MIQFDYDKIMRPNVCVYCDTERKARALLRWADSKGIKWSDGDSFLIDNNWSKHNCVYYLLNGTYGSLVMAESNGKTIYKYEDVLIKKEAKMKSGWYYIKLWQSEEIENILPPTRCVYIKERAVSAHESIFRAYYSQITTIDLFDISEDMIESPAYTIGKEYEFSDDGDSWVVDEYMGYDFTDGVDYPFISVCSNAKFCREIQQPQIEITVKINGKESKLSDISEETLKKIREMEDQK